MSDNNENRFETNPAATADEATINPYLADAIDRVNRLRAVLEGFPKLSSGEPPVTPSERRIATVTTVEGLEQAALFAEEQPNVGGELADVRKLRDKIHFLLAYERLREQALFFLGDIDQTIIRQKVEGAKYARGLYRMAKAYATSAPGQRLQSKVAVMKQTFGITPRRKPNPPADPDAPAVKK